MRATAAAPVARPDRRARVDLVQLFLNGAGRIDRRAFVLAIVPVGVLARAAAAAEGMLAWALGVMALATGCAVLGKRLHDLSRAGWWAAAPAGLALLAATGRAPTTPAQAAALLLAAGWIVALAAWPGERRFNRFGPPPGEPPTT